MITPDPRLVAALAAALDEAWVTEDGGDSEQFAVAVLPAFLADPRTHEWLVERVGLALIVRLRAALDRFWRANRFVHSAYDGECEHCFGPPATLCPNDGCPDKELAEAWSAVLAIVNPEETDHD